MTFDADNDTENLVVDVEYGDTIAQSEESVLVSLNEVKGTHKKQRRAGNCPALTSSGMMLYLH